MSKVKFDSEIKLVSKQVHPDVLVSTNSKIVINNFLNLIINHIIKDVVKNKSNKKEKITPEDIQNSLRNVFGTSSLVPHAISEGTKAVRKFDFYTRENKSKSQRMNTKKDTGLIFQVSKINKFFKENNLNAKKEAQIYLAAVLEYLTAEITELSGNQTLDNKKLTSMPHFIFLAIKNDPELILLADNVGWDYKILEKKKSIKSVRKSSKRSRKSVRKRSRKSVHKSSRKSRKSVRKSSRKSRKILRKSKLYAGMKMIEMVKIPYNKSFLLIMRDQIIKKINQLPNEDKKLLYSLFDNVAEENWKLLNEKHREIAGEIYFYNIQNNSIFFYPRDNKKEIERYLFG